MADIWSGIVIGGAGGAIAGLVISLTDYCHIKVLETCHKRRIYKWLKKKTSDKDGKRYRSTRAITSWNNLTEDRVRYICSIHKKIYLSTGDKEDMWALYEYGGRSISKN